MRMSLMFAAVTLLTGINLFFIPFQPVPALWGAILAVAFVLINVVADKLRLWSGIAWIIVAGIIITLMLKGKEPGDEFRVLITVFAFLASIWYSVAQFRKENKLRSCRPVWYAAGLSWLVSGGLKNIFCPACIFTFPACSLQSVCVLFFFLL